MMKNKTFLIQVDKYKKWDAGKYREVSEEELDALLKVWADRILTIVSNGKKGVMAMWACFKSRLCDGCYADLINAYDLLVDDSKDLVSREHELRHLWEQYQELWRIRYYGSVAAYHLEKANEAEEYFKNYNKSKE